MKKLLKTLILTLFSFSVSAGKPVVSLKTMDTLELFERTLDSVEECIEYCLDGISLYMIPTPWGFIYYLTLNVSHNSPDILMMTHNELNQTPYEEFNGTLGNSYKNISEKIIQALTGFDEFQIGGGRERHKKWGEHQAVAMKEATALGHPAAIILKMLDRGGVKSTDGKGNIVNRDGEVVDSSNVNYGTQKDGGFVDRVEAIENQAGKKFGESKEQTQENMDKVSSNQKLRNMIGNIKNRMSKIAKDTSNGMRLFCPSSITPFMPYYLSGLDAIQWRLGFPLSDFKYSKYVLNPLSGDVIGTKVRDEFTLKFGKKEKKFSLPKIYEMWGNMFPREGVLNHPWDSKRGTVIAARAAHILVEDKSTRVRYKPDSSNNGFGGWGKIFPVNGDTTPGQTAAACHKNIANTGITINETGGYAWTFWRRYNCDLRIDGIHLETAKFPEPICITSEVPE